MTNITTKIAKNGTTMYYLDGKRIKKADALAIIESESANNNTDANTVKASRHQFHVKDYYEAIQALKIFIKPETLRFDEDANTVKATRLDNVEVVLSESTDPITDTVYEINICTPDYDFGNSIFIVIDSVCYALDNAEQIEAAKKEQATKDYKAGIKAFAEALGTECTTDEIGFNIHTDVETAAKIYNYIVNGRTLNVIKSRFDDMIRVDYDTDDYSLNVWEIFEPGERQLWINIDSYGDNTSKVSTYIIVDLPEATAVEIESTPVEIKAEEHRDAGQFCKKVVDFLRERNYLSSFRGNFSDEDVLAGRKNDFYADVNGIDEAMEVYKLILGDTPLQFDSNTKGSDEYSRAFGTKFTGNGVIFYEDFGFILYTATHGAKNIQRWAIHLDFYLAPEFFGGEGHAEFEITVKLPLPVLADWEVKEIQTDLLKAACIIYFFYQAYSCAAQARLNAPAIEYERTIEAAAQTVSTANTAPDEPDDDDDYIEEFDENDTGDFYVKDVDTLADAEQFISEKAGYHYQVGMPLNEFSLIRGSKRYSFAEFYDPDGCPKELSIRVTDNHVFQHYHVNILHPTAVDEPQDLIYRAHFLGVSPEDVIRKSLEFETTSRDAALAFIKFYLPRNFYKAASRINERGQEYREMTVGDTQYQLWKSFGANGYAEAYSLQITADIEQHIEINVIEQKSENVAPKAEPATPTKFPLEIVTDRVTAINNANRGSGWAIGYEHDNALYRITFGGESVATLDSLASTSNVPPEKFFSIFQQPEETEDMWIRNEIDALLDMRDQLIAQGDTERAETVREMIDDAIKQLADA